MFGARITHPLSLQQQYRLRPSGPLLRPRPFRMHSQPLERLHTLTSRTAAVLLQPPDRLFALLGLTRHPGGVATRCLARQFERARTVATEPPERLGERKTCIRETLGVDTTLQAQRALQRVGRLLEPIEVELCHAD